MKITTINLWFIPKNGDKWAKSGWAGGEVNFGPSDASQSGPPVIGSSESDFRPITTTGGTSNHRKYDPIYPDHPKNSDGTDNYPGKEIIKTDYADNLVFTIVNTGEALSVPVGANQCANAMWRLAA